MKKKNPLKLTILFVLFVLCGHLAYAQNNAEHYIKSELNSYFSYLQKKEFDSSMKYIHPGIFVIVPKDKLVEVIKSTFENDDLSVEIDSFRIINISKPVEEKQDFFSIVDYQNNMVINLHREAKETEDDYKGRVFFTASVFEGTFGEKNVSIDPTKKKIIVLSENKLVAVSPNGETNWKFVVANKKQEELLKHFLPKKIIKLLKK